MRLMNQQLGFTALIRQPTQWIVLGVLCLSLFTLAWDASGLDLLVMHEFADTSGFIWRHHPVFQTVLHDWAKNVAWGVYVLTIMLTVWPAGPLKRLTVRQRFEAVTGVLLALMAISVFKNLSHTSCPWDLHRFGGVAQYVSHWSWADLDGGPGRCFPGGHASGGFAFIALAWPWFSLQQPVDWQRGLWVVFFSLAVGSLFGAVQTVRGAHYPSHTLWTLLICVCVTWAWHWIWRWSFYERVESI